MISVYLWILIFAFLSYLLIRPWISRRGAIALISIKWSIPIFLKLFGTRFLDDWGTGVSYRDWRDDIRPVLEEGHTPLSLLLDNFGPIPRGRPFMDWWTGVWMSVIGDSIFAPALANSFVVVLGSVVTVLLVRELGAPFTYQKYLLIFSILHWDILAWTNIVNYRYAVLSTVYMMIFYLIIKHIRTDKISVKLATASMMFIPLWVVRLNRDYMLVVILAAFGAWLIIEFIRVRGISRSLIVLMLSILPISFISWSEWSNEFYARFDISGLYHGLFQFTLGPTWWDLNWRWIWLFPTSLLHWIFAPIALIGTILLLYNKYMRLLFIFAALTTILFSAPVGAEGITPQRMRMQLVFFIVIVQFHGLWFIFTNKIPITLKHSGDNSLSPISTD